MLSTKRQRTAVADRASGTEKGFLREVFDHASDAILVADDSLQYVEVNRAAELLTGYTRDELLSMRIPDIVAPGKADVEDQWASFMRDGVAGGQIPLRRPDGTEIILEHRSVANFIPGFHLSVLRDITDRVEAIEDRERALSREREARLVAERTAQLLARLQRVNVALVSAVDPASIAEAIVSAGIEALGSSAGALAILDDEGKELRLVETVGHRESLRDEWGRFPLTAPLPLADAVRERRLILLTSREERDRLYPALSGQGVGHAWACIPVTLGENVLAGLAFTFADARSFEVDELAFMRALGEITAFAIERGRLYEAERLERERAEAAQQRIAFLADASEMLFSSLDIEESLPRVAKLVVPFLADWCCVHLVDGDGTLRQVVLEHPDQGKRDWALEMQRRYTGEGSERSAINRVIAGGDPVFLPEVTDEIVEREARSPEHAEVVRSVGIRSAIVVPLLSRERIVGALTLLATVESGRAYDEDDLELAQDLARRAGVAVENARLYREVRAAESELRLNKALLEWQNESTLDGVLAVDTNRRVLWINRRYIEMWHPSLAALEQETHAALLKEKIHLISEPDQYVKRIEDLYAHPNAEARDEVELTDGRVLDRWSAPLRDEQGELRGRAWYYRDVTMRRLAERELRENQRRAELLADATAALSSGVEERPMLAAMADVMVDWFADWCVVDMVGQGRTIERTVVASRDPRAAEVFGYADPLRSADDPRWAYGPGKVIDSGMPDVRNAVDEVLLRTESRDDERYLETLRDADLRAYVCVPLKVRSETIGALTFVRTSRAGAFGASEVHLVEELAFRVASAIEHARLYRESRYISTTLQRSLLPPVIPPLPGMDVAARYHAASEGALVGGDFYDIFETAKGDWVALVGDVCGKGADAAATTALARHTIRAAAMQARRPSRVLATLNEAMMRAETQFCTVAYARIRTAERGYRATVASGGHPLPFLLRADGSVERAGRPGTLLGAFASATLTDAKADLLPGDSLILYTDGVLEARSEDDIFGEERLASVVEGCAGMTAEEIAEAIERAALDFASGQATDDIAIVVLRVR